MLYIACILKQTAGIQIDRNRRTDIQTYRQTTLYSIIMFLLEPQIEFTEEQYTVSEDDGQVMVCAEVTLSSNEVPIWLTFSTANGTALGEPASYICNDL